MSETTQRLGEFKLLAHALAAAPDEAARLKIAVESALGLITTCDHAGITINERGGLLTRVSSDELVRRANELQYEMGEGPCLDIKRDQDTLVIQDLARDERWPRWARVVHQELGATSMMSLLVYTDERSYGALSLYAAGGRRFDADDLAVAQALAGHLAVIMASERAIDQLQIAVVNRTVIGQAQGILMERLEIDADHAFDYLRRLSMDGNQKLTEVARDVVRTRELPGQA